MFRRPKFNTPIIANIICEVILNFEEIPDELLYLIFLKSSYAPNKPKVIDM